MPRRFPERIAPLLLLALPARALAEAPTGQDFLVEATLLSRIVACVDAPQAPPLPAHLDLKVIEQHCRQLRPDIEHYRASYVGEARAFIAGLRPADLPKTVVYPFGGGDLISALTTYPDATEITTISLEHAGDPRRVHKMTRASLETSLHVVRATIEGLLTFNDSKSVNLMRGQRGDIPGQLAFFLVALAVHGYEPVGLRYFTFTPEGDLRYLSEADIQAAENKKAGRLRKNWTPPDFSEAFSNLELTFVPIGARDAAPRVHRHVAANLANEVFTPESPLARHLTKKGKVSAMTKAASYLLWRNEFSHIRDYLLAHMAFMISDSTGIPTRFAEQAGFVQETYGQFTGSFLGAHAVYNREFVELWKKHPRPLPFRYGYVDAGRHDHLLITRPKTP